MAKTTTKTELTSDETPFVAPKTKRNPVVQKEVDEGKVFPPNQIKGSKAEVKLLPSPKTGIFRVRLGALVSLSDTNIPEAKDSMRSINKTHLESLLAARDEEVPPIAVQNSSEGFIVYDGYHRWARAIKLATRQFVQNNAKDLTEEEVRDFVETGIETDAIKKFLSGHQDSLNGYIDSKSVQVLCKHFSTYHDLIRAAKMANLAHGLPASKQERCKLAVWFLDDAALRGEELSLRKAAKMAGVSHVAVIHYRDAKLRITENLIEGEELTPEQEQALAEHELSVATKNAKNMCSLIKKVFADIQDDTMADSVRFIGQYFTDADYDAVSTMAEILSMIKDNLEAEEEEVLE